jgi:hypothetical protein
MRKARAVLGVLAATVALSSCRLTHPDQENYIFDGGQSRLSNFVRSVEKQFNSRAKRTDFVTADNERNVLYELTSPKGDVDIISLPDDRCNPNASTHLTFNEQLYEVDLVFKTSDAAERRAATVALLRSARDAGGNLQPLEDCN